MCRPDRLFAAIVGCGAFVRSDYAIAVRKV